MLTSQQIDTLSGIVCNYDNYVVYYYADYYNYSASESRDSRIIIYVGSDIRFDNGTFTFGSDVETYYFTYNQYLNPVQTPSSFTVSDAEIVYTNLVSNYPDLCFWETRFQNADIGKWVILAVLLSLALDVVFKVIFGGKE